MIVTVSRLLTAEDLEGVRGALAQGRYQDGKLTAGWHARLVKENQQLERKAGGPAEQAEAIVTAALSRNDVFQAAVLPARARPLTFSRYETGMRYGAHVDNAIMGPSGTIRSDVSFTVFLAKPEDYDGGNLVIESTAGETAYKLDAGSAIIYPSTSLHRVDPVTRGVRDVAVGWAQSLVRDAARREILFDLDKARRAVFQAQGKGRVFDLLAKSYSNLLRQWAET